jgi:hypothetical protein
VFAAAVRPRRLRSRSGAERGLRAMSRLTGAADKIKRSTCAKCGEGMCRRPRCLWSARVIARCAYGLDGHLSFQCMNFLTLGTKKQKKAEVRPPARAPIAMSRLAATAAGR